MCSIIAVFYLFGNQVIEVADKGLECETGWDAQVLLI
jgi:hypothetical protein